MSKTAAKTKAERGSKRKGSEPAKMGRPSTYTAELGEQICDKLAEGFSLRQICALEGLPGLNTVIRWLRHDEEFRLHYTRARELQAEIGADDMIEIADDASQDVSGELKMPNAVAVQRAKLRVETRKWTAMKLLPKKYGERVQQEHTGEGGGPLKFVVTRIGAKE